MSISYRIILLVSIITLVLSLFSVLLIRHQISTVLAESEIILASTINESLRDAIVQDVINNNRLRISNLLKRLQTNDNPIEYLYVTGKGKKVFAHSFEQGFPRYLYKTTTSHIDRNKINLVQKYQTNNGLILDYGVVLIPGLDTTLHIGINQTYIRETLNENTQYFLSSSIIIGLIALVIAFFWGRKTTMPLIQLTEQIKNFGLGRVVDFNEVSHSDPDVLRMSSAFQVAVNERNDALKALQEREQNLAITLNSIGDAVITTDANGHVDRMNPVAEKLTGWTLADAQKKPVREIFPIMDAKTREPIQNPIDTVIKTGKTVYLSNHTTLISKDKREYQIADSAAPIINDDKILGMVLIFNDVTEQYQLREAARKSKRDLQAIMDHSPAVIYVKDHNGHYLFINKGYEKLFHINNEEIIGKSDADIFDNDFCNTFQHNDVKILKEGLVLNTEFSVSQEDGLRSYSTIKFPLSNDKNEYYAICGIATDITESKLQAEQLRHSQKMDALGKLTGGIAHDYNNILGIIQGYAEQLNHLLSNDAKLLKYSTNIYHAAERGARLTKKLLRFSSSNSTEKSVIDINSILLKQQEILEKTLTARVKLIMDLEEDLWLVELQGDDFENAIINMCINALHAMEDGGTLTIQTRNKRLNTIDAEKLSLQPEEYVILSITDTGSGMDDATKEKIFDPFFTTKEEQGTGLGLSQVYGLVESCKGTIKVYSEVGHGSCFVIYLPKSLHTLSETVLYEATTPVTIGGAERILVVDDEKEMLDLANEILYTVGYKVFTAEDGIKALNLMKKENVDVLVTDIIMPNMDGYQLISAVQRLYPKTKILIVSGYSEKVHHNHENNLLFKNMLHKPYNSNELLARLRDLLDTDTDQSLAGRTILVMDDEQDLLDLFHINLKKFHCKVVTAMNGDEAINQYRQHLNNNDRIDACILDLNMPGRMSGIEVADELRRLDPSAILILSSGSSQGPEMQNYSQFGFNATLEKTFNSKKIKHLLENLLL